MTTIRGGYFLARSAQKRLEFTRCCRRIRSAACFSASVVIVPGRIPVPFRRAVSGRFPEEQVCMAGGALHSGALLSASWDRVSSRSFRTPFLGGILVRTQTGTPERPVPSLFFLWGWVSSETPDLRQSEDLTIGRASVAEGLCAQTASARKL